ncbi:MAG: hypothetical protein K5905_29070 [Roseibium sp.]|uniref:hypothetical protein n=1 Tax=Roseibium sp. TaxID=1936156 RepID=UPI0026327D9F|nr:hypothetical protein [Roseibium sp.]MCV0429512.1 hypothetical protein [Roseibium sp.]
MVMLRWLDLYAPFGHKMVIYEDTRLVVTDPFVVPEDKELQLENLAVIDTRLTSKTTEERKSIVQQ